MNLWQTLRQLQYLLRAQTWEDGTSKVFSSASVLILPDAPEDIVQSRQTPLVFVRSMGGERDPEAPGILSERIGLTVAVHVPASDYSETAMIGANRASVNGSLGRGLLEIEERAHDAAGKVVAANGVRFQVRERSGEEVRPLDGSCVIWRTTVLEGYVTQDRSYAAAQRLVATGGSGQVSLSWSLPPTRYDTRRAILRRASGATPPVSATSGTGVTLGGSPDGSGVSSVVNSGLAAGTYSYSLFIAYDETGSGSDERYSPAATAASVVVT